MHVKMAQTGGIRIGELLVAQGVLAPEQVDVILEHQRRGHQPFGELAEQLFHVSPKAVEQAWVDQYLSLGTEIDLSEHAVDPEVLKVISRRQAWQFRTLPLRREPGELVAVTSREHLKRAVNFAWRTLDEPVYLLVAPLDQIQAALEEHYPLPGALEMPAA